MRYDDWRMLRALAVLMFAVVSAQAQLPPAWESGSYVYDGAGNIKSIGPDQFRYDASGRLVSANVSPGRSQSFTYDAFGNILTLTTDGQLNTFGVNSSTNRISEPANVFASYDAAGRVTTTLGGSDEFEYDALDMVTRSEVQGVTKVHLYTASGERIASVTFSGGSEVRSDWTLRDESGKVLRRLEKSGATWSWREDYVYGAGQLLAAENGTDTLHFFSDHLGTPRLITNRSGGKISAHKYLPFGDEITDPSQDTERLKFTGHERDASTLDYMHARYYFPKWGRFLSVDPTWSSADLSRPQSWNRYSYVMNNPVNMTDPDGKVPILVNLLGELAVDFVTDGNPTGTSADDPPRTQAEFDQRVKDGRAVRVSEQYAKLDQPGGPKRGSAGGPGTGKKFDDKTKEAARAQSDNKCVFCQTETTRTPGPNQSNIDHAIAKARGGNNTLENAQNACRTCNLKKAVKDTVEFLTKLLF